MNIIFLAPQFSENHYLFCEALRKRGINVLGIGDTAYDDLRPQLTQALDEYYKVDNMEDYTQVFRAVAYFTYHYGKIDRLESLNYYLLETQAKLRTDFNIPGINLSTLDELSGLRQKKLFRKVRVGVLRSILADTLENGQSFVNEVGYPVLAKADNTAAGEEGCLIANNQELAAFYQDKPATAYALEEIVEGVIFSFEGLIDISGKIIFETVHQQSGQTSTELPELNPFSYSLLEIPSDIEKAGHNILKAADLQGTFFAIRFIRTARKKLIALNYRLCPHSEFTPDFFNYANDFNIYAAWAAAITGKEVRLTSNQTYHCAFIGRRKDDYYSHTHEELLANYGHFVIQHKPIPPAFRSMGDYGYIVRSSNLNTILSIIDFAHLE